MTMKAVRTMLRAGVKRRSKAHGWTPEQERKELARTLKDAPWVMECFNHLQRTRKHN